MGSSCCCDKDEHDTETTQLRRQQKLLPESNMSQPLLITMEAQHPFNIKPMKRLKTMQYNYQQLPTNIITDKSVPVCDSSDFTKCPSAHRIKLLLSEYDKIIDDTSQIEEIDVQTKTNKLVNNLLSDKDINYSNVHVKLMNDFYHIKYNHNINDDRTQFDEFHQYLTDNKNKLTCDMNYCKSVERYNRNRNKLLSIQLDNTANDNNDIKDQYSLFLLSRIHTFFIHSFETAILTNDEIKYIEGQLDEFKQADDDTLNDKKLALITKIVHQKKQKTISTNIPVYNLKYITSDHQSLNYANLTNILNKNGFNVQKECIASAFDNYGYYKHQLMDDLCDIFSKNGDSQVLLSQILIQELQYHKFNERLKIYKLLLSECTRIEDLNNNNFIKLLTKIVADKYHNIYIYIANIENIARDENLNGHIFIKTSSTFRSSLKFGQLFKSIPGRNKKIFGQIYVTIKQRKWIYLAETQLFDEKQKHYPINLELPMYNQPTSMDEDSEEEIEEKGMGNSVKYKVNETDEDKLQLFCAITRAETNVAVPFLKETDWNVVFAVRKYYGLNGNISKLDGDYKQDNAANRPNEMIYNDGIQFWYWDKQKHEKQYINPKTDGLKNEILNNSNFTSSQWDVMQQQCNILMQTNQIKAIVANGQNADIYGIKKGDAFTVQHLYALKLYTDYSWLCKKFCEAFRLKKLTTNTYERMKSLRKRNTKVANWARLLIECVQSYGNWMSKKRKYYRGIDMEFIFKKFITRFHVPLSTTTDFTKATEFAQGTNGLVIELKRHNKDVRCFNCSIVSSFDTEKETLFFDDKTILQIASVFQWWNKTWSSYRYYIDAIQRILKIIYGSWNYDQFTNQIQDLIAYMLPGVYSNCRSVPPYVKKLLEYHLTQLPNKIEYDYFQLTDNSTKIKQVFVKNKETNALSIANLCNLFKHCDNICILMPVRYFNENDRGFQSLIDDMKNVLNKNVTVEFKWKTQKELTESQLLFQQHTKEFINNSLKIHCTDFSVIVSIMSQTMVKKKIKLELVKQSKMQQEWELRNALKQKIPLILYDSFLKVYSLFLRKCIDVAAVLTKDNLYFISAVKYELWEQFRNRSKIEQLVNHDNKNEDEKIKKKTAIQLAHNLHIIDDDKINNTMVIPYLMTQTKKQLKTNILCQDSITSLAKLFDIENNEQNINCIKYIEIKDFYGNNGIPEPQRNSFMACILDDVSWIDEQKLNNSNIIQLRYYSSQLKIALLNEKCQTYCEINQLSVNHVIRIYSFIKNRIEYSHNEVTCLPLHACNVVERTDQYKYGFILKSDSMNINDSVENTVICVAVSNNQRYEWITHLECLINFKLTTKQQENEEKHTQIHDKKQGAFKEFRFGTYLDYWQGGLACTVLPKYHSLKSELLNNKHAKLPAKSYFILYAACTTLIKFKKYILLARNVGNMNKIYNIQEGTPITINHLMSLKLYTDYNETGSMFRKHCRQYNDSESMQDFVKRNSEIAHWCRYIKESCILYGTSMSKKKVFYTGLKDILLFNALCQHFECSLSTTIHPSIAEEFADDHGMVLSLQAGNTKTRYFDVSWLSHYQWERERIVMGSLLIIDDILINNVSQKQYIHALIMLQQIIEGQFIDRNDKTEIYLYELIAFVLDLDDKPEQTPSTYIIALFECMFKRIVDTKKIWVNQQELLQIKHTKLKDFFVGFFNDDNIDSSKLNFIQQFTWTIDGKEYQELMDLKPHKYIVSKQFVYEIYGTEQIKFHLQCYRQYSGNNSKKCALYLHTDILPSNISIQTSCDVICEKKSKRRNLASQYMSIRSPNHEILTFPTKSLNKQSFITWKLGMKIENITPLSENESKTDLINEDAKYEENDDIQDVRKLQTCSANQIIFLLRNYIFPEMNQDKVKKNKHSIISYIEQNKISGNGFIQMDSEEFAKAVSTYNNIQNLDESFKTIHQHLSAYDLSKIRVFNFGKSIAKTELANVMNLET